MNKSDRKRSLLDQITAKALHNQIKDYALKQKDMAHKSADKAFDKYDALNNTMYRNIALEWGKLVIWLDNLSQEQSPD